MKVSQRIRGLAGALLTAWRRRQSARGAKQVDIGLSFDGEWVHHRREGVPLCIATKQFRS